MHKRTVYPGVSAVGEVLAILTFLTVVFLFVRAKYLGSSFGEFSTDSRREHMIHAAEMLQDRGYQILEERISHEVASFFGARKFVTYVVVDFIVEKDGVRYPVKVRSPRDPDRISGAWLRRQLLAIYTMYESPIAYVHPETGTIDLVDFALDFPRRHFSRRWRSRLIWLLVGVVAGWLLSLSK